MEFHREARVAFADGIRAALVGGVLGLRALAEFAEQDGKRKHADGEADGGSEEHENRNVLGDLRLFHARKFRSGGENSQLKSRFAVKKCRINKSSSSISGLLNFWKLVVSSQFAFGEGYESERFHKRPDGRRQGSAGVVSGHVSAGQPAVRAKRVRLGGGMFHRALRRLSGGGHGLPRLRAHVARRAVHGADTSRTPGSQRESAADGTHF